MATILTAEVLIRMLKQSGLVEGDQLDAAVARWKSNDIDVTRPRLIAIQAVKEELITRWQAEKLLQGKHRGFFLGKYRLLTLLGTGGMSSVYLAEHTLMRRQVAIKVLPQSRVDDASYLERFHRESQAVAALDHPNIVRAYDVNQEGNVHFLVMEYVAGQSLQELVAKNGPLDFVQVVEYVRQIAAGLEHAHDAGLIHRDIKPANLLVDERGVIKMLDLGLARFFHAEEENPLTLQYDEKVLGTADYLSPEQALDSHKVDTRADIYSLGCTMYFLLLGHPPFPDGTLAQRLMFHQMKEPASLKAERPETQPHIVAIVEKMMQKEPEDRFQTVRDVSTVCKRWLNKNGGDTWKTMKSAALDSAASKSTKSVPRRRKNSPTTNVPRVVDSSNTAETQTPEPQTPELQSTHDNAMADFLAAMSNSDSDLSLSDSEAEASTVTAEIPSTGSRNPKTAETISAQRSTKSKSPYESAATESAATVADDEKPASDSFDFNRETAAPVSSTTNVIKSDPAIPTSSVLGDSKASQSVSAISQLRNSSISLMRRRPKLAIAISVSTLLIGVAIIMLGFGPATTDKPPGSEDADRPTELPTPAPPAGPNFVSKTIGPNGDFQTFSAALGFAAKTPLGQHRDAHFLFSVVADQVFKERIVINNSSSGTQKYPHSMHFVVKDGTATLAPGGPEPVISIIGGNAKETDVSFLHLEGFNIDAKGAAVAIKMAGVLPRCEIRRSSLSGYTEIGIQGDAPRAFHNEEIVLSDLTFQSKSPSSIAVQLTRPKAQEDAPSNINLFGCRFLGPMRAGLEFAAAVHDIEVEQCIFYQTQVGIDLSYANQSGSSLRITNNSFYQCGIGVQFKDLQQIGYPQFAIEKNAFIACEDAAVRILENYETIQFLNKRATNGSNWSDRPLKEKDADIFRQGGTAADFKFKSTDPSLKEVFLIPDGEGQLQAIGYTGADR
ncbi:Serine/threonine-protein kinase PrkC [Symmachiella macrocystis]|uniref:Serine/threonine-protein kinase PrkC n=1 Tax=Symmachiella macrocystis TaxID=2527985 RepID=A0A5C6BIJ3_9PLAN|nr:serine/threonine-protein kinase [Symmachiella macrocystis]TWU11361.1 Serine/threonine-protein kinase PrkC [Symmachiella macrocystis]